MTEPRAAEGSDSTDAAFSTDPPKKRRKCCERHMLRLHGEKLEMEWKTIVSNYDLSDKMLKIVYLNIEVVADITAVGTLVNIRFMLPHRPSTIYRWNMDTSFQNPTRLMELVVCQIRTLHDVRCSMGDGQISLHGPCGGLRSTRLPWRNITKLIDRQGRVFHWNELTAKPKRTLDTRQEFRLEHDRANREANARAYWQSEAARLARENASLRASLDREPRAAAAVVPAFSEWETASDDEGLDVWSTLPAPMARVLEAVTATTH